MKADNHSRQWRIPMETLIRLFGVENTLVRVPDMPEGHIIAASIEMPDGFRPQHALLASPRTFRMAGDRANDRWGIAPGEGPPGYASAGLWHRVGGTTICLPVIGYSGMGAHLTLDDAGYGAEPTAGQWVHQWEIDLR